MYVIVHFICHTSLSQYPFHLPKGKTDLGSGKLICYREIRGLDLSDGCGKLGIRNNVLTTFVHNTRANINSGAVTFFN